MAGVLSEFSQDLELQRPNCMVSAPFNHDVELKVSHGASRHLKATTLRLR